MFREFLTWWSQQLGDLVAPVLPRFRNQVPNALLLNCAGEAMDCISLRRRGRITIIAESSDGLDAARLRQLAARHRGLPLVVTLARPALIRDIALPAAAAGGLRQLLEYEIDQFTPFKAADAFFTHEIKGHDRPGNRILVRLILVPRAWLEPVLATLEQAGLTVDMLETSDAHRIPLRRSASASERRSMAVRRAMTAATAALAVAVVALPLLRQSLALADVDQRIAELRPGVEQAEQFRRRIAAVSAGAGRIAALRQEAARPLAVLADVTEALPDDTWLTGLTIRQNRLVIEGRSHAATRLIAALAGQPHLRNPGFAAPVVRSGSGEDVFTIQAEVAP